MSDRIVILDFGSQFTQLIGRRIRDMHVYCELLPWNAPKSEAITPDTQGIILSGGPQSIYAENAPYIQDYILNSHLPILGIAMECKRSPTNLVVRWFKVKNTNTV
jgi:GMP synthase (glutamine-hydrolysing)